MKVFPPGKGGACPQAFADVGNLRRLFIWLILAWIEGLSCTGPLLRADSVSGNADGRPAADRGGGGDGVVMARGWLVAAKRPVLFIHIVD
jgi:hypothetical protein